MPRRPHRIHRATSLPRLTALIAIFHAAQLAAQMSIQTPGSAAADAGTQDTASGAARTLGGRVLDQGRTPLAGIEVILHRVTSEGGAPVALDTTDAAGAFALPLEEPLSAGAVYFAAVTFAGRIHVGTPFRGPVPAGSEYVLVVGADPTAAASPGIGNGGRDVRTAVAFGLVVVGLVLLWLAWRGRRPRGPARPAWRVALIRAAAWEEYAAAHEHEVDPATGAALLRRARDAIERERDAARQ